MDIFYKLPKNKVFKIIEDAKEKANNIFIDRKDDKYVRQKCEISYEELIKIFRKHKMHWVFIYRESFYAPAYANREGEANKEYFEIGGCTLGLDNFRDYFLFLYLDLKDGIELVEKYKLKPL